ncbi:type IV pilus modification PilV family protein [Lichenifustis flavocetrariae]|uniref:Prepilin-type N-terminal cleavage/methylation domain-containing protein n=1 Tax=Lichenifustis flavocetrariae TaxID=2949735 RepID=A0AA41YX71_9HYPH|nr:prepilin-type N-terminal cleavage/methylation domain-containing protein [Lichenifustis flavocetrariae]MCW6508827.1 prepilin-type N-terminal cleavage/methylation domain-containing protein [Lichenifustis flavocetrariae]
MRCRDRDGDRQDGFTLIEVLIAMTVLAMLSAVLLHGAVDLRANAAWFDDRTAATLVATTLLDETLADRRLHDGTYRGTRDGRSWTVTASSVDLASQLPKNPAPGPDTATAPTAPVWRPQRVTVIVEARSHPLTVETLRLVASP